MSMEMTSHPCESGDASKDRVTLISFHLQLVHLNGLLPSLLMQIYYYNSFRCHLVVATMV